MATTRRRRSPSPGRRNTAADYLTVAFTEYNDAKGSKKDALILAAAALADPSMPTLAEALLAMNNASEEGISTDDVLDNTDNTDAVIDDVIAAGKGAAAPPATTTETTASAAINRIIRRRRRATAEDATDPDVDPDAEDEESEALDGTEENDDVDPEDLDDDADIDEEDDEEPDPADPAQLAESPATAADGDEEEVDLESDDDDDGTSNMGRSIREADTPAVLADIRTLANRLSLRGDDAGRTVARGILRTGNRPIAKRA